MNKQIYNNKNTKTDYVRNVCNKNLTGIRGPAQGTSHEIFFFLPLIAS